MDLALKQAHKGLGNTGSNPSVGCVVTKNDCVIASAYTGINGRPHAEQKAIGGDKINSKNAYLYVTMEPCSHYGETPPCVNLIIKKKIRKVFYSVCDPDIRSYKKSKHKLKSHRLSVKEGLLLKKTKIFYKSYFKLKSKDLPYVSAKLAISKDFFTINKQNRWLTNIFSRGRVHLIRSKYDCIMTSVKTIMKDDPTLNCRIMGLENKSPTRIILDKKLEIPINSKIIKSAKKFSTIIFYNRASNKKLMYLKKKKIKLIKNSLNSNINFDLRYILMKIKSLGFSRILIESGRDLMTNFLSENLVDDFYLFISNKKIKNNGLGSFRKTYNLFLKKKEFTYAKVNLLNDSLLIYRLK